MNRSGYVFVSGLTKMPRSLRDYARPLAKTPFHPQWLMPERKVDPSILGCRGTVLDIGSADGWLRTRLSSSAGYVSLDYPDTATGLYGTKPDVFGNASNLPFADQTLDAVACYEVIEHVREPDRVMQEIARVLAPGGVAELSMPFMYPVHDAPYDFQRWTSYGWERGAQAVGLEVEKLEPTNSPIHAAAVMVCIALSVPLQQTSFWRRVVLLPTLLILIPAINVSAWIAGYIWPKWSGMTSSHRVLLRKPS